jgi:competence protein ComEA
MVMNHLGFSVKEANGTMVLVAIISLFIFAPVLYGRFLSTAPSSFSSDKEQILKWKKEFEIINTPKSDNKKLLQTPKVPFDPNQATKEEWIELGIKPTVAARIINYREAGGRFNRKTDLLKIYGIDSMTANHLMTYLLISPPSNVPVKKTPGTKRDSPSKTTSPKAKLAINKADQDDFREIYGIGEKLSSRIIKYRNALGGFHSLSQLSEVYYLQDSLLPKIEATFVFDKEHIQPISINTDSLDQIKGHPYLSYNQAKAIINFRQVHGRFGTPEDLLAIKIISDNTFEKLKPYISVKE